MNVKDSVEASDYYQILGVRKDAPGNEIKNAYRKRAKEVHPDRNQGDNRANEKFLRVQMAFDILNNPEKRAEYDKSKNSIRKRIDALIKNNDRFSLRDIAMDNKHPKSERVRAAIAYIGLEGDKLKLIEDAYSGNLPGEATNAAFLRYVQLEKNMYALMKEVYSGKLPNEIEDAAVSKYIEKTDSTLLLRGVAEYDSHSKRIRVAAGIKYLGKIDSARELENAGENRKLPKEVRTAAKIKYLGKIDSAKELENAKKDTLEGVRNFAELMMMDVGGTSGYLAQLKKVLAHGNLPEIARVYVGLWCVELEEDRETLRRYVADNELSSEMRIAAADKFALGIDSRIEALELFEGGDCPLSLAAGIRYVEIEPDVFAAHEIYRKSPPDSIKTIAINNMKGEIVDGAMKKEYYRYLKKHGTKLKPPVLQRKIEKMKKMERC